VLLLHYTISLDATIAYVLIKMAMTMAIEVVSISSILSSNKEEDLQLCVLILICTRLFLRCSEASGQRKQSKIDPVTGKDVGEYHATGLTMSSFISELAMFND
jgi:hypothetical protein